MPIIPKKLSSQVKQKYQVKDNTFFATTKDDWRDRIDVVLGNNKERR